MEIKPFYITTRRMIEMLQQADPTGEMPVALCDWVEATGDASLGAAVAVQIEVHEVSWLEKPDSSSPGVYASDMRPCVVIGTANWTELI